MIISEQELTAGPANMVNQVRLTRGEHELLTLLAERTGLRIGTLIRTIVVTWAVSVASDGTIPEEIVEELPVDVLVDALSAMLAREA